MHSISTSFYFDVQIKKELECLPFEICEYVFISLKLHQFIPSLYSKRSGIPVDEHLKLLNKSIDIS